MNRDGFEFDLVTQRFLTNRWETDIGEKVLERVIETIKRGGDARGILDPYVLDHPENQDPYGHPYYPKDAMTEDAFWVLTQDDLRGIHLYNEHFPKPAYFGKKSLNYCRFYNCSLIDANFENTSLTAAVFDECDLQNSCVAMSGGYYTSFLNCNMKNACFTQSYFEQADFSGSNLTQSYFELAKLRAIKVSYLTVFDEHLNRYWSTRVMPENEEPEILKSIRIAYEEAEIWPKVDQYLYLEREKNRKAILWAIAKSNMDLPSISRWAIDWSWHFFTGYGVKPSRTLVASLVTVFAFAFLYYAMGNPGEERGFAASLYFSLVTFTTLGYGDLHYPEVQWVMRLVSAAEAFCGASLLAIFVAVMSRKLLRR